MQPQELHKKASYCYPMRIEKEHYKNMIEAIKNDHVRTVLKTILTTGFRINEVLNCYFFYDDDKNIICRGLASKTKEIQVLEAIKEQGYSGNQARFLGREFLLQIITSRNVWKSVKIMNLFELDLEFEKFGLINDDFYEPKIFFGDWLGTNSTYNKLFKLLKQYSLFKVKFKAGKYEDYITTEYPVSFHFFRKLFVNELNVQNNFNIVKTVDYIKWRNMNILLDYAKDY